jgi:hypothetical protein
MNPQNDVQTHYEKLYCKSGTCSFCFKVSKLCFEFEPTLHDDWTDENNKPILCQECDDLCWIHERPVINTPHSACVCEPRQNAVSQHEVSQNAVGQNAVSQHTVSQHEVSQHTVRQ